MSDNQSRWPPRPVRALAGRALEAALNRALALDPATRERVATLDGRSVEVYLRGPELRLRVAVDGDALRVGPASDDASLKVAATPGALAAMALDHDTHTAPGSVEIAGDAGLARQIEKLVTGFDPDFEAALSARIGAVAGVPIAQHLAAFTRGARRFGRAALRDGAAWARDEVHATASAGEVEDFLDGVDALGERLDRLEARIARRERPR